MSVQNATEQINAWIEELNAMTGVVYVEQAKVNDNFDPEKPIGPDNQAFSANPSYDPNTPTTVNEDTGALENFPYETEQVPVNGAFSCERLQELVDQYVQHITDSIASHAESIANIMSTWAPLLSLPSDPLKILTWAAKVVGGPVAQQIALIVQLVIDLAQLASAIANLISAVTSAIAQLISCLEQTLFNAIDDVINSIYQNAANLIATAESLVDSIIANALQTTGAQDLLDEIDAIGDDLGAATDAMSDAVTDAAAAAASIEELGTREDQLKSSIALNSLSLQTRIDKGLAGVDGTPIGSGAGGGG